MERVTFLLEDGAERVSCLLNPERLVVRRSAGVTAQRTLGGLLSGRDQPDDPLLPSGGGVTELELELLFDTSLSEGNGTVTDVRELTRPLWRLAEGNSGGQLARVRFLWGKAWNIPGVILAAAELFEAFDLGGAPQRSWLKLKLRRVAEPARPAERSGAPAGPIHAPEELTASLVRAQELGGSVVHEVSGGQGTGDRVDVLATRYYGSPALWRLIAAAGDLRDPLQLVAGTQLRLPSLTQLSFMGTGRASPELSGAAQVGSGRP